MANRNAFQPLRALETIARVGLSVSASETTLSIKSIIRSPHLKDYNVKLSCMANRFAMLGIQLPLPPNKKVADRASILWYKNKIWSNWIIASKHQSTTKRKLYGAHMGQPLKELWFHNARFSRLI